MLVAVVLTLLVILATHFYYTRIYLTTKKMNYFKKIFQEAGYRVYLYPFKPFTSLAVENFARSQALHGHPLYHRQVELQNYDVAVGYGVNEPQVWIFHPDLHKAFFSQDACYEKYGKTLGELRRVMGSIVSLSEGNSWKRKRRILSNTFHFDFLRALIPSILGIADEYFDDFEKSSPELLLPVMSSLQTIISTIIVRMFFGIDLKNRRIEGRTVTDFVSELVGDASRRFDFLTIFMGDWFMNLGVRAKDRDINRRVKLFREFGTSLIKEKVEELKKSGFKAEGHKSINLLEELYLANNLGRKSTEEAMDYQELVDEFCGFFFAGTDTTSHLLTTVLLYLSRNPEAKQKLIDEVSEVIKTDADYNEENFKKLVYMSAVINETQRIYGPGINILTRIAVKDHSLNGVPIAKGTIVNVDFVPNNFNAEVYAQPLEFRPERWLGKEENGTATLKLPAHPYQFTPFSSGQRNCLGQHLARLQAKILLSRFLKRYDFEVEGAEKVGFRLKLLVAPENFSAKLRKR